MINRYRLQLNVGHDVDGNIFDWSGAVAKGLVELGHDPSRFEQPPDRWNVWEHWQMSKLEFDREYRKLLEQGLLIQTEWMIPGELEFLMVCSQRGHNNHIITSRNEGPLAQSATSQTYEWVATNLALATINSVTISSDKAAVTTDLFFDDKPDNVRRLMDSDCLAPYLVDQPWNQEATDLDTVRVFSAEDKLRVLLSVEDTIADILELEPLPPRDLEDDLTEQAFWDQKHEREGKAVALPDNIKEEQLMDEARRNARSVNERLRNG